MHLIQRTVRWPIAGRGAARGRTQREAILVELVDEERNTLGVGEAAPLTGHGNADTIEVARDAIDRWSSSPFVIASSTHDVAEQVRSIGSPSARFAVETALLDAIARRRGVSIAKLLVSAPAEHVAFASVVDDPDEARIAAAAGVRCLKIKVGPDGDLDRVRAIAAAAPSCTLRLDTNRSWPVATVRARLASLAGLPIEYVEEPCHDAHRLLVEPLPCPLALDESIAQLTHAELDVALDAPGLAALVLKPTLLGGMLACLSLAERARQTDVAPIVSHALEGPIGTAACAELALAIGGDRAAGLAPHAALAAWNVRVPQLAASAVHVATAAGLGLVRLQNVAEINPAEVDRRVQCIVATPTAETLAIVQVALAERRPIALLHPKLPAAELVRQREIVSRAELPEDTAVVLFTSGSTGPARGVVLSRDAIEAAAAASASHLGWRDDDRWLLALSMAHAGGLAIVVRCLLANKPVLLVEGHHSLAARLADCTLGSLVPAQLAALLDDADWRPPSRLRAVLLGGAPAPRALLERAAARGVPFLVTYGMTETFGQITTAPPARAGDPAAPLVPLPGVLIDAGTRAAPAPIRVRGPMLASCYLDGPPIAPELETRDLGFFEDGALHVVGRTDDVIVSGGEKLHASAIEAVLAETPGVRAACAYGIADARWGQIVGATIAVDAAFELPRALAHWHAALPPYGRPRELAIAPALPLLASGKIDRSAAAEVPRSIVTYVGIARRPPFEYHR